MASWRDLDDFDGHDFDVSSEGSADSLPADRSAFPSFEAAHGDVGGGEGADAKPKNEDRALPFEVSEFRKEIFDPDRFIVELTKDLLDEEDQKSKRTFDPKPLQEEFDAALRGLKSLAEENDAHILKVIEKMKIEEAAHEEKLKGFETDLTQIFSTFRGLDKRISQVVHTAVRTGDRLELVENRKKQTERGQELIQHFLWCNSQPVKSERSPSGASDENSGPSSGNLLGLSPGLGATLPPPFKVSDEGKAGGDGEGGGGGGGDGNDMLDIKDLFGRKSSRSSRSGTLKQGAKHMPRKAKGNEFRGADGRILDDPELGKVLRALEKISIDVHMKEASRARDVVSKRSDEFQKRLLKLYVKAVKDHNQSKCKEIAHILSEFEARDCMEFHVSYICEQISSQSTEPGVGKAFRDEFKEFYTYIRMTWNQQAIELCEIFPLRTGVFEKLLRGIFANNILPYVNVGLDACGSDLDMYLDTLEAIYASTRSLVRDFQETMSTLPNKEYSSSSYELDLNVIMDNSLIVEYRKGYIEKELDWLKDHVQDDINSTLSRLDEEKEPAMVASRSTAQLQGISVASSRNLLDATADPHLPPPPPQKRGMLAGIGLKRDKKEKDKDISPADKHLKSPRQQNAAGFRGRGFSRWKRSKADKAQQERWLMSILQDDLVPKIINSSKKSLKRCNTISDPNELANNVHRLFDMILKDLYNEYFKPTIEAAQSLLPSDGDSKTQPNLFFMSVVKHLNDAILPVQIHFSNDVAPLLSSNNQKSESAKADKNMMFTTMEEKFLEGLKRCLEAVVNHCARILSSEQKKSDFKPKDDSVLPDRMIDSCSKACTSVTEYIATVRVTAAENLTGRNLDVFYTVFGMKFYNALMDHYKKYTVSSSGTLLMMRDTKEYQDAFIEFHIAKLSALFDSLRHLVNLLAVPPRDIQTLRSRDNILSKLDSEDVHKFLQLRADYKTAKIDRLFKMG